MIMKHGRISTLLILSYAIGGRASSSRQDRRHRGLALSTPTVNDPPVLTPRFLDRFYQDDDLVIAEKQQPLGWFRQALRLSSAAASDAGNDTFVTSRLPHNLVASHFVTVVGIGAWLKLAWKQWSTVRRRRQLELWNVTMAFNDTKAPTAHVVTAIEERWAERYDVLLADREQLHKQLDATLLEWNATQSQLQATQERYDATREQLATAEKQIKASTHKEGWLQEQVQARDLELNFTREQSDKMVEDLHTAREQQEATQKLLHASKEELNGTKENLRRMNESMTASALLLAERDGAALYWEAQASDLERQLQTWTSNQTSTADQLHRLKDSMLAVVEEERSALMEDFHNRMAKLRSALLVQQNATDASRLS